MLANAHSDDEAEAAYRRALKERFGGHCPFRMTVQLSTVLCVVEQLQIAFRQEGNVGPGRDEAESLVRKIIETIDPEHGVIYDYLVKGLGA